MPKKKSAFPLPTSVAEVNEYISALALIQQAMDRLTAKANQKIQDIKANLSVEIDELDQEAKEYAGALFTYFEKNRKELTNNGERASCAFATGTLGQRWTPPRTQISDEPKVADYVVQRRLTEFYEKKIVLRRDAMLANQALAATIPGVSFVRDRIIFVKPDVLESTIDLRKRIEPAL